MDKVSLDSLMKKLETATPERVPFHERNRGVTFWIPRDAIKRYEHIQRKTRNRFSKVLCELIVAAIDQAEDPAA